MTLRMTIVCMVLVVDVQALLLFTNIGLGTIGIDLVSPALEGIQESSVTVSMWLYAAPVRCPIDASPAALP